MQTHNIANTASRLALALSLVFAGAAARAADADTADHTAHHPEGAASAPKSAPVKKPTAKSGPTKTMAMPQDKNAMGKMEQMDVYMKAMQDLHQKFLAAKTPEERNALMPEHMKAMQEAMTAMGGMGMMGGADKTQMMDKMPSDMMAKQQMMEKRMDMMQSMMQMMMDRLPPPATK
jgi:hypothetical protein